MAEEGTLGLARAHEPPADDFSKEDLQRRLDVARDSISHTVTEIKETVANQVQAVKETLDWREQFKKRPVAWSVGALGVGFAVGYCVAATVKGDGNGKDRDVRRYLPTESPRSYAAQAVIGGAGNLHTQSPENNSEESGPGILERLTTTPAYDRVRSEVGGIGNAFLDELSKTAKSVLVPALIKSIGDFLGGHQTAAVSPTSMRNQSSKPQTSGDVGYRPVRES